MSLIRLVAALSPALLLTACVATTPPPATPAPQPVVSAPVPAVNLTEPFSAATATTIREKFSSNAPRLLCDQPQYLTCYQISREQCLQELNTLTPNCQSKADTRIPQLRLKADLQKYTQDIGLCLTLGHLQLHTDRAQQLTGCFQTLQFNAEQGQRSLLE